MFAQVQNLRNSCDFLSIRGIFERKHTCNLIRVPTNRIRKRILRPVSRHDFPAQPVYIHDITSVSPIGDFNITQFGDAVKPIPKIFIAIGDSLCYNDAKAGCSA